MLHVLENWMKMLLCLVGKYSTINIDYTRSLITLVILLGWMKWAVHITDLLCKTKQYSNQKNLLLFAS